MSRRSVLSTMRTTPSCSICGEQIECDVVRVDDGRIFHLRCFRLHVPEGAAGLYECPRCRTLGCTWDWQGKAWRTCTLCNGGGYLAAEGDSCGN